MDSKLLSGAGSLSGAGLHGDSLLPLTGSQFTKVSLLFFFQTNFICLFYFWLCWVFVAVRALLEVQRAGSALKSWRLGLSLPWLLLFQGSGPGACGLPWL